MTVIIPFHIWIYIYSIDNDKYNKNEIMNCVGAPLTPARPHPPPNTLPPLSLSHTHTSEA